MPSHLRRWMEVHAKRGSGAEKLPSTINTCWHNFIFFFTSCQPYFSISLAPFCKRITLPLFVSIFHLPARRWWQWKKARGGHKNGHIFLFLKKRKKKKISGCSNSHAHVLQLPLAVKSPAPPSPPAPPYPHVQHSQPAVKLIASTSFQGHTITASYSQPCYMNT